jgi:hypothetical protein
MIPDLTRNGQTYVRWTSVTYTDVLKTPIMYSILFKTPCIYNKILYMISIFATNSSQ